MAKKLIVFYSHSGNTRKGAQFIQELTGADLLELQPKEAYPNDLWETIDIFKEELKTNARKELIPFNIDIDAYDILYIGTPNWGDTVATPLLSFFDRFDLSDKKIMPFVTHGGGGLGNCSSDIIKLADCKESGEPLVYTNGNIEISQVSKWLKS